MKSEAMMNEETKLNVEDVSTPSTTLTDEQIEDIIEAAEASVINSDIPDMRKIKEEVQVDPDAPLESEVIGEDADGMIADIVSGEASDEEVDKAYEATMEDAAKFTGMITGGSKQTPDFGMPEEEMMAFVNLIANFNKDKNYPVYKNMPEAMKKTVRDLAAQHNVPVSGYNQLAKAILEEFIADSKLDRELIDLQKSIDDALNIPSIVDLYSEHTRKVMEEHIPQMAEKIREEAPDKADRLLEIKRVFTESYTFSRAEEVYDANARVRKAMRRWDTELKRTLDEFNFSNDKSDFKMPDVTELPEVLVEILINEPNRIVDMCKKNNEDIPQKYTRLIELEIAEKDIAKFLIMICKSCRNLDPYNIIDAAYMYYLVKNIAMLKHTQEAKTDFAIELINNICDAIVFIRSKEDAFNECVDKPKSGKKHKRDT